MDVRRYFSKHPQWTVIIVTRKPIEEIAAEILAIRRRGRKEESSDLF